MPDLPAAAIQAAAKAIAGYGEPPDAVLAMSDGTFALANAVLEAAAPHLRAALYAELGNEHYVIFTADGWTTEHSVECRLSGHMHECAYHTAVARIADGPDPGMLGRWKITDIDSEGLPSLEREPASAPGVTET